MRLRHLFEKPSVERPTNKPARTMTVEQVIHAKHDIYFSVVEVGLGRGQSMRQIAESIVGLLDPHGTSIRVIDEPESLPAAQKVNN